MKKYYIKPEQRVVKLQHKCHILAGSNNPMSVRRASNNADMDYIGSDEYYEYGAR